MDISKAYNELVEYFVSSESEEWVDINVNNLNLLSITIISDKFKNIDFDQRYNNVLNKIKITLPYEEGFFELYTIQESKEQGILKPIHKEMESKPSTWKELSSSSKNEKKINIDENETNRVNTHGPKIVSFYSYKGGVGRTVALTHAAYILASRGKK